MPKKFTGMNQKSAVAKAKKNEAREVEKAKTEKAKEDAKWAEDDTKVLKKLQRKEEQELKRLEAQQKKQENKQAYESEMQNIGKEKPSASKVTKAQIDAIVKQEKAEQERERLRLLEESKKIVVPDHLQENMNRMNIGEVARNVNDALKILGDKGPAEPQKSLKTAYSDFEARRLPQLKEEKPTLRLSQLKQLLKKEWQKSPENPLNEKIMGIIS
ncbi:unnamed protein product [Bursaphelenchus okinawaensis]|uniref:Coiled-coil domain-containing protein n=1 Tax=Bursaphelenchus okinawaensis TaxID=465554 RepID=A0A811JV75_9BILA|nr:unnamed protein product [Bursaphelenchus okinawaensis]CAG9084613.1 unnamed protein product [Bursaphelenchus okinawaensis]